MVESLVVHVSSCKRAILRTILDDVRVFISLADLAAGFSSRFRHTAVDSTYAAVDNRLPVLA